MDFSKVGIPGMLLQLENALGISLSYEREVRVCLTVVFSIANSIADVDESC